MSLGFNLKIGCVNPHVRHGKVSFYRLGNRHQRKAYLSTDINKSDRYAMQKYYVACICRWQMGCLVFTTIFLLPSFL